MTPDASLPPKPSYVAIAFISAPPERVWRALTDPLEQIHFFGGKTEIGETGERWIRHATDKWPALTGTVLAKDKPHRLLLTWGFETNGPPDRVEFLIEPTASGTTRLSLRHYYYHDWPEGTTEAAAQGWAALLSGLKTLVETGKPLPPPF